MYSDGGGWEKRSEEALKEPGNTGEGEGKRGGRSCGFLTLKGEWGAGTRLAGGLGKALGEKRGGRLGGRS